MAINKVSATICRSCKQITEFGPCSHCKRWNDLCVLLDTPFKPNRELIQKTIKAIEDSRLQEITREERQGQLAEQLEDETRL